MPLRTALLSNLDGRMGEYQPKAERLYCGKQNAVPGLAAFPVDEGIWVGAGSIRDFDSRGHDLTHGGDSLAPVFLGAPVRQAAIREPAACL